MSQITWEDVEKLIAKRYFENYGYIHVFRGDSVAYRGETYIAFKEQELRDLIDPPYYEFPLTGLVTSDGEQQYLTQKGEHFFACRKTEGLRQKWRKEHFNYLPQEYIKYARRAESCKNP